MCSFDMEVQSDEFAAEYEAWTAALEAALPQQIRVIGTYALCNWGGYEVGEDESGDCFYRFNTGDRVTEWEPMDTLENPHDDYELWAYNPDQQAFLFPLADVLRVA